MAYVADEGSGGQAGGIAYIDISNPSSPSYLGMMATDGEVRELEIEGNLMYVADAAAGMKIYNMVGSTSLTLLGSYDSTFAEDIFVVGDVAYIADYTSGLLCLNVSNPTSPTFLSLYDTNDCRCVVVRNNIAYITDTSDGIKCLNVSDPSAPTLIGSYNTPGSAFRLDLVDDVMYIADSDQGLVCLDISNPSSPTYLGNFTPSTSSVLSVKVSDNIAYLSYTTLGVVLVDVRDPTNLNPIATYASGNLQETEVFVRNNLLYVSSFNAGLKIYKIDAVPLSILPNTSLNITLSRFFGGSGSEIGYSIKRDNLGNIVVLGSTQSSDLPMLNAYDSSYNGGTDVFLAKFSPSETLLWSTYLGGSGSNECGYDLAITTDNQIVITGRSDSGFPAFNGYDTSQGDGGGGYGGDIFVMKFSSDGVPSWSTFIGGGGLDTPAGGIVLDDYNNIYIGGATGYMSGNNFPIVNAYDTDFNGGQAGQWDAVVCKLSATGQNLLWSTFIGGNQDDYSRGIDIDSMGNVVVGISTASSNFPTLNAMNTSLNGAEDYCIVRFSPSGALISSTYLGGSGYETASGFGHALAVDDQDNIILVGGTASSNFPVVNPVSSTLNGSNDIFITKFNPMATSIIFSTYFGGSSTESVNAVTISGSNDIWITGNTASSGIYYPNGDGSQFNGGNQDIFLAGFSSNGTIIHYNYLGTTSDDYAVSLAIWNNNIYLTGFTGSSSFSNTLGTTFFGSNDVIIVKYSTIKNINNSPPTLSSPIDQTWNQGTTGQSITWIATDTTVGTTSYVVYCNGTSNATGSWSSGVSFSVTLDGLSVGLYNFTCIVQDGFGGSAQDQVLINITLPNVVPSLSTPDDQSWNVGTTNHSVSWTVTDTTTQAPRSYSIWQGTTCVQIGTWTTGDVISYTLDGLAINTYTFELQVNDGIIGGNFSDQVSVTVQNILPSLTSPADQTWVTGTSGHSLGWIVTDSSTQSPRLYSLWNGSTCIQTGNWEDDDVISIILNSLVEGSYIFELQVNDGYIGGNASDSVSITVEPNSLPILTSPVNQSWNIGTTGHSISWTITDLSTEYPRSYSLWNGSTCIQIGEWKTNDIITCSIDGLVIGTYLFEIQVNDGIVGGNNSDQVSVTVLNIVPTLDTPADQNWEVGTTGHSLSWIATDASTQVPRVFSIWQGTTCIATGTWVSESAISQSIDDLTQGSYIFEIQVNDGFVGGNASDSVSVTVNVNAAPTLSTPADQSRVFGATGYFISWTATDTSIGTTSYVIYRNGTQVASNSWLSGSSFSISLDGLNVGIYNFTCVVSDGIGGVAQNEVIITITNVLPTLSTPGDIIYTVGTTGHTITWTPTDASTDVSRSYSVWRGIMCLASGTWNSGENIVFSVDGFNQGTWGIEIQINDGYIGGNTSDTVIVTVTSNSAPMISTPADQTWLVGTIGYTLNWTISDGEIGTTNYAVYQNGLIVNSGTWTHGYTVSMNLTGLEPGMYNYTIIVNDGLPLGQSTDSAWIIVWNHAPEVISAADQSWAMNTTGHSVSWTPTDVDFGTNVWYNITQNGVVVVQNAPWSSGVAITRGLDSLLPGTYLITITLCDGYAFNATVSSTVQITVTNALPTLSSPADMSYGNGTLGHYLNWTVSDVNTMNATFQLFDDGILKRTGGWISGDIISANVDGLAIGTHNLTIVVNDGYNGISQDLVWITVYDLPPFLTIQQPTNGTVFTSINNLVLNYYCENLAVQTVWYKLNTTNQWVVITGNTTFNALYPGYQSLIVVVQSMAGENYTSAPAVFRIVIENSANASIEITMQVVSGTLEAGQTLEVQVTITNKGSVDLTNVNFYLERITSEYQFTTDSTNNYTFAVIATGQSKVFTITLVITQTTNQIMVRGHFTADVYHQEFAYPLTPGSATSPLVYVFSVAGVAAAGGGYYGLKKKKGFRSKSIPSGIPDKHADKHEPSLNKDDDVEFQF